MAVQYTNRKRITYYLHEDNTKTGDLRYFFSAKNEGNLVDTLPKGYEYMNIPILKFSCAPYNPKSLRKMKGMWLTNM